MSKLQVETISHTNNTTAQTIDSTGRILTPARPAFRAYKNASGYVELTHGQFEILTLNTTEYNVGSGYDTSTYRFTAPVSGLYYLNAHMYSDGSNGSRSLAIVSGTSNPASGTHFAQTYFEYNDTFTMVCSCVVSLTANDQVGAYVINSSDSTRSYYSDGTARYTNFEGYLLG